MKQVEDTSAAATIPSPEQLAHVQQLYDRSLCLQAHEAALAVAPVRRWRGTAARILAGRLALNLGAPRLGRGMHYRAYREEPAHPEAILFYGFERASRGPLVGWEYLQRHGDLADASPRVRADWLALKATVAGHLRDFDTAEAALEAAMQLQPRRAWLWVERASLLEAEDRYEEALAAAREALQMRPWYRPAVQATAHALQLLDRDEEALALLVEADRHIESGPVAAQLAALQCEMHRYDDARESYRRFEQLSPLMEKDVGQWLTARRCDVAYYCGEKQLAIELARQVEKSPFHETIAKKLAESDGEAKRVLLDLPFVRQHHMTCAPATLSAISRFWAMPADHLAVVESICYDGTPAHSERNWAAGSGWVAREFTVTWESAAALIDRGIPFTLTTVEPASAHLQAVVGYDSFRGTLLVRDPYQYFVGEMLADAMLERYRSSGPRGMAMVPADRAHLLDGLRLPDAELYDLHHEVQRCLVQHERQAAAATWGRMNELAPGHRLTISARRSLAAYDQDPVAGLECVEALLELYPDDAPLLLAKVGLLRSMTRRQELLDTLEAICARKQIDPIFWQRLADELHADARLHGRAEKLLRRAMRFRPRDAWNYYVLAGIYWDQRRWEASLDLYRFSTTLEDKDDGFAHSYFVACRHFRQTEAAIRLLRGRFERLGKRSGQPARTLFRALEEVDRTVEAFKTLDEAIALRPGDGELLVFAAMVHGRHGNADEAARLLGRAGGKTRRQAWLSASAQLALHRGELRESLELWKQILEIDPLAMEAHQNAAQILAETESRGAAVEHLRAAATRFPHHAPLHQLYISWLREEPPAVAEEAIRVLVANQHADAWARRELAMNLLEQNRVAEAQDEAEHALKLEPTNPANHYLLGRVLAHASRFDAARESLRQAIRYSVDADYAIAELVSACPTPQQRREALAFVRDELARQTIFGDGLLAYRAHASDELDPAELYEALKKLLDDRPDLWHAWSAVIAQLTEMNRAEKAVAFARDATERFPLLPRLWVDRARAHRAAGERDAEIAALREALRISPGWGYAARELAGALERGNEFDEAKKVLEAALRHAPTDAYTHGCLADILWKTGRRDEAVDRLQQAVRQEPGYRWAWDTLRGWSQAVGRPALAVELARELTQKRPGEARSWLVLANLLDGEADAEPRLAALDRAIELNARLVEAHDQRVHSLVRLGRLDDAAAACAPAVFGDQPPLELRARQAWVEHARGNVRGAIAQLRAVLADAPNAYGAWRWLADWLRDSGDETGYVEAARALARLWPLDPFAIGYLADAKLRANDRDGAKADLRRAVQLAPDYVYAVTALCDLELEDDELDRAEQTLAILRAQIGGHETSLRELQLAARRGDRPGALAKMADLCVSRAEDGWYFDTAIAALGARGWNLEIDDIFAKAIARDDVNLNVPRLLSSRMVSNKKWRPARKLIRSLDGRGEVQVQAMLGVLSTAADTRQRHPSLRFVRSNRAALRADSRCWGLVAYLLLELGLTSRAVRWMSDWREREDAKPWALQNLAVALHAQGKVSQAGEVARAALALPPDNSTAPLRLWAAYDDALAGRAEEAQLMLQALPRESLTQYYQFLHDLIAAHVELARFQPAASKSVLHNVRRLLRSARGTYVAHASAAELRRAQSRLLRGIIRRAGLRTPLWVWWQWLGPGLTVLFCISVGVGAAILRERWKN